MKHWKTVGPTEAPKLKVFRVASVSSQPNSFGLHGHILVAEDGEAWEVGRNRGLHLNRWNKGADVAIRVDVNGHPEWAGLSVEIPRRLPDAPKPVLAEIFR